MTQSAQSCSEFIAGLTAYARGEAAPSSLPSEESGGGAAGARMAPGRLLKIADVERETSLHRATIYRRIADGEFPRQISLGARRVVWLERDIEAWKATLLTES